MGGSCTGDNRNAASTRHIFINWTLTN